MKYDQSLSKTLRKKDGVYYTPDKIAKFIVDETLKSYFQETKNTFFALQNVKILDISCGDGTFLVAAFDFLLQFYQKNYPHYQKNYPHFEKPEQFIVRNNLFGVDLDENAVKICQKILFRKSEILCENIKCGNSLIDDSEIALEKAFFWENEFAEIFKNGGFDIIVGNPPYGAELSKEQQKFLTEKFESKSSETVIFFIKQALNLLKNSGILSFIIPKSFVFASNYKKIRDFVWRNLRLIVDCKKVWKEVNLEQVIIQVWKTKTFENYATGFLENKKVISSFEVCKKEIKDFEIFPHNVSAKEIEKAKKMRFNSVFLNEIAKNQYGGCDRKHLIVDSDVSANFFNVIGGANIDKFQIHSFKGKIEKQFSDTKNSLVEKNSILVQRIITFSQKIDNLRMTACIPDEKFVKNLILVDTIIQIVIKNEFLQNISQEFLWCVLNSRILNWFVMNFIFGKAIITMDFTNFITSRLPIPRISVEENQIFIEKAKILQEKSLEKQKILKEFFILLQKNLNLQKFSRKISEFYLLEYKNFVSELKKQNIFIKKTEYFEIFQNYKTKINEIYFEIQKIEEEIEKFVRKSYKLLE